MRMHQRVVPALRRAGEPATGGDPERGAGAIILASPSPGRFRIAARAGDLVRTGSVLGELEVLGRCVTVTVPDGVRGAVSAVCGGDLARPPVDHGVALVTVDPSALGGAALPAPAPTATAAAAAAGRVFRAPSPGRFYSRPHPDRPPFVVAGDPLAPGVTVCMLEKMKTFIRITYSGEPACVRAVLVADGTDVKVGDPLLALE